MVLLQLGGLASLPGAVGALIAIIGFIILVRFVVSLAIRVAILGLIVLGGAMVLNELFGLGLPVVSGF